MAKTPLRAPAQPAEAMRLVDEAGMVLVGRLDEALGPQSAVLTLRPALCTSRGGGLVTWRLTLDVDLVVVDTTAAAEGADARAA
jgi:hypothetical protein